MTEPSPRTSTPLEGAILSLSQLPRYTPPGHRGTTNVRLVEGSFTDRFELVLGVLDPGGIAERHRHTAEAQAIYVLGGRARVSLGDRPPEVCGPQTVILIPPGLDHEVVSLGPEPLTLLIVYSPPLRHGEGPDDGLRK
jgi:quercetin dioxygenase-like cupin family protein